MAKSKEAVITSSKETPCSSRIADLSALAFLNKKFTPLVNSKPSPQESDRIKFAPSYKTAVEKDINVAYYVIYDGPHQGIYTNWGEVSSYTNGTDNAFRKFNTLEQARQSAQNFNIKKNTGIIFKASVINKNGKKRMASSMQPDEIFFSKDFQGIPLTDFRCLWSKARCADQEDLFSQKFFTDDKATRSLFNFVEGANPKLVHAVFRA